MQRILKRLQMREAVLQAELIEQKEMVQEMERKSTNKSIAFARASHDVRNSLQSITLVLDQCLSEADLESELARNLKLTKSSVDKLQGIMDSLLETSKVESGKMQLEETEFDILKIIEESVDSINMKVQNKDVTDLEMIWDPCDLSVLKLGNVRGDALKFKQILDNLLGNAEKCTPNGKIVIRAWAKKHDSKYLFKNPSFGRSVSRTICCFPSRGLTKGIDCKKGISSIENGTSVIELTFEVDDTGIGIPVEKRNLVFENYVQIKPGSALKEKRNDEPPQGTGLGLGIVQSFVRLMGGEISIRNKEPGSRGTCFKFNIFLKSSKSTPRDKYREFSENFTVQGVQSLLLMRECESKVILQRLLASIGIEVHSTQRETNILPILEKIKHNLNPSSKWYSISARNSSSLERDRFLSLREGDIELFENKISYGRITTKIFVIVDLSSGDISKIWSTLRGFIANNPDIIYKIICVYDSNSVENKQMFKTLGCHLLHKPIHGSRLCELLALIQELERMDELQKMIFEPLDEFKKEKQIVKKTEIIKQKFEKQSEKPLNGMHILYVDDDNLMRMLLPRKFAQLGAKITQAGNGADALQLVKKALETRCIYDIIIMDCQMDVMDGYEATIRIREEESRYRIRVPIIALSGHAGREHKRKSVLSGMDFHLTKPFETRNLLEAIDVVRRKGSMTLEA